MDTEEEAGMVMRFVIEKIWGNYLTNPVGNSSWYVFQNPKDNPLAPSVDSQNGAIQKIQSWQPRIIENLQNNAENPDRMDMTLVFPGFKKFRSRFLNPETAFSSYRVGKTIYPPLPNDTRWEHMTIKFLNEDKVEITLADKPDFKHIETFDKMGFENSKKHTPNMQWKLLQLLAMKNGELSWQNNYDLSKKDVDAVKKKKQKLSDALQKYFQIEEDPFFSYRTEKAYKIKINLIPE